MSAAPTGPADIDGLDDPDDGVLWFSDERCRDLTAAGGKGANLGRLVGAGFAVPPGFVVPTSAYETHVAPFRDELEHAVAEPGDVDRLRVEALLTRVRGDIEALPVPDEVAERIREAYAALGGEYVAVRSSGTAEDLDGAAFAGLHDTSLDVRGEDELLEAVRRTWASVWTARAATYRRHQGYVAVPSIAVVVQVMLEPEVAGVLFTADPVTRSRSRMLVSANWGLGESVVGGTVTPDQFTVRADTFALVEAVRGDKQVEVVRDAESGHGVREREVDEARRARLTLDETQVAELARLGAAVEEHYDGVPQDVEWARAGDRFWLLQARPVTGVAFDVEEPEPEADLAGSPVHRPGRRVRWTTANVDENMPGTITPLTWSVYFPATESTMRDCWVDLGVFRERDRAVPDDVDGRFISVAHGHAIANVDLLGGLAARVPGGSAEQIETQLFGAVQGDGPPPLRGREKVERWPSVLVKLPRALRRAMRALPGLADETDAYWRATAFALDEAPLAEAISALTAAREHYERVVSVHMVLSVAAPAVMGQVEKLAVLAGLPGLERELVRSEQGTTEFHLVRDLWRLARGQLEVEDFVRVHGYHGPREGLVDAVVWREDPTPVIELARAYASRDTGDDADAAARARSAAQADAVRRLSGALPWPARAPTRALVRFAAHVPGWRETGRTCILQAIDVARAAARRAGTCLAEAGALDAASDVWFLTVDELVADRRDTFRALVARRREDHAAFERVALPHLWTGAPEPVAPGSPPGDAVAIVEGIGVSAGVAEGTVVVVHDLSKAVVGDEAVLVCRATDPAWASLFPLATAVVTDVGSALSHAAIVCRELGLPCVASTRTGTRDLHDGMRVRVDGSAGVVSVLDEATGIGDN